MTMGTLTHEGTTVRHDAGTQDGTSLLCRCFQCQDRQTDTRSGGQKLGEIHPRQALRIKDGRHLVILPAREVIERIAGTTGQGAVDYVASLFRR